MKREQLEKIKDVIKILDAAKFNDISLKDMIDHVNRLNIFAKTINELLDEADGKIKIDDKNTIKKSEKEDGKSK